jgi:putative Holliday junction resolvase
MRIMGLDYGSKTCGVALSDELLMTAQPVEIIRRDRESKIRKTLSRIEELCEENQVGYIVLGLPLNMDDSAGVRAENTMAFREQLERRTGLPVVMSDERLTTVEAYEIMDKMEIRREDRGRYVDMIAASIILREYMENHRGELEQMRNEK